MKTSIVELRKQIGQTELGLPDDFNGTAAAYSALDASMQVQLTNAMMRYITAHPEEFTTEQADLAKKSVRSGGIPAIDDYTLGEKFADFTDESLIQVTKITDAAGSTISRAAIAAAVVAVLWFGAPYVLPKLKAAFTK